MPKLYDESLSTDRNGVQLEGVFSRLIAGTAVMLCSRTKEKHSGFENSSFVHDCIPSCCNLML